MTAFTVGHTESYDRGLRDGYASDQGFPAGSPLMKVGRTNDLHQDGSNVFYGGGCVFPTAARAACYLIAIDKGHVWSVYEIDADYEHDCYQHDASEPYRSLLKDVRILRKVRTAAEVFDGA